MSSALLPDKIRPVIIDFLNDKKKEAGEKYNNILPLINFENRQCGFQATKIIMKEGGVINSAYCRHPIKILIVTMKQQIFGNSISAPSKIKWTLLLAALHALNFLIPIKVGLEI